MLRLCSFAWRLMATTALVTACGGGSGTGEPVKVAAELKSLSCDPGSGIRVSSLRQVLESNKISVESVSCGAYSVGRPAVCGVPDDALAFFVINEADLMRAKDLGFFDSATTLLAIDYGQCPSGR